MNKTLVFGFDGTIVKSRDVVIQIYNNLAEKNGYRIIENSKIEALSQLPLVERCSALNIPSYKIPFVAFEIKKNYKNYLYSLELQSGIIEVLKKLKEMEIDLYILSSNNKETIKEYFQKNNIDVFTHICSSKNLFGKHYAINRFVKSYRLDKKDILYIGGEVRDIVSCKKAGIKIASIGWGYDSIELLKSGNPDYIISNRNELVDIACRF